MEIQDKINEIKEMNTYKLIVKDSFGGVMYMKKKEIYDDDIITKFKELELICPDIWNTTDGIFRGVYSFIMREED